MLNVKCWKFKYNQQPRQHSRLELIIHWHINEQILLPASTSHFTHIWRLVFCMAGCHSKRRYKLVWNYHCSDWLRKSTKDKLLFSLCADLTDRLDWMQFPCSMYWTKLHSWYPPLSTQTTLRQCLPCSVVNCWYWHTFWLIEAYKGLDDRINIKTVPINHQQLIPRVNGSSYAGI